MNPAQPKRYYSVKEAANLLSVSTNTLYKYLDEGKIKGKRIGKGRFKVPYKELLPYLEDAPYEAEAPLIQQLNSPTVVLSPQSDRAADFVPQTIEVVDKVISAPLVPQQKSDVASIITNSPIIDINDEVRPSINDKIFWMLFKAMVFFGLGVIYLFSSKLNFNFSGGYLNETSQILNLLLPFALILAGILTLLQIIFEDRLKYFDTVIHIIVLVALGYYSYQSLAMAQYGRLVFSLSFIILLGINLLSGVKHSGNFFDNFTRFSVLASVINGIIIILFPKYFPFPFLSESVSIHPGIFGFLWFGLITIPFVYLLSDHGKKSRIFAPLFYFLISIFRLFFATQLAANSLWDTAYIVYMMAIFGFFLSWWNTSEIILSKKKSALTVLSFIWISIAILIGLFVVNANSIEVKRQSRLRLTANLNGEVQKIKTKIEDSKALLVTNAGNPQTLEVIKSADPEKSIDKAKLIYERSDIAKRVMVIDKDGKAIGVYPRNTLAQGENFSDKDYFKNAKQNYKGIVSPVFTNIFGDPAITAAEPVFDGDEFAGLLALSYDLNKLSVMLQAEVGDSNKVHVVDDHGTYAFGSNLTDIGKNSADLADLKTDPDNGSDTGKIEIYQSKMSSPDWTFYAATDASDPVNQISVINILFSIFIVINSVFAFFAGIAISNKKNRLDSEIKLKSNLASSEINLQTT